MEEKLAGAVVGLAVLGFVGWLLYQSLRTGVVPGGASIPPIPRKVAPVLYWFFVGVQGLIVGSFAIELVAFLAPDHFPKSWSYPGLTRADAMEQVQKRLNKDVCLQAMKPGDVSEKEFWTTGDTEGGIKVEIQIGPARPALRSNGGAPCYLGDRLPWLAEVGPGIDQGRRVIATESFVFKRNETGVWKLVD